MSVFIFFFSCLNIMVYYFYFEQGIYQLFYNEKSSADKGSLYQLRNLLNRRNVSGPEEVNSSYRYCSWYISHAINSTCLSILHSMYKLIVPIIWLGKEKKNIKIKVLWYIDKFFIIIMKTKILFFKCFFRAHHDL